MTIGHNIVYRLDHVGPGLRARDIIICNNILFTGIEGHERAVVLQVKTLPGAVIIYKGNGDVADLRRQREDREVQVVFGSQLRSGTPTLKSALERLLPRV